MQINWYDTYIHDTKISLTNPELALNIIRNHSYNESNYICLFGLYPLTQSFENQYLQKVLNQSYLNPLHGKSIEIFLKRKGHRNIQTIDGVFLLDKLLQEPLSHFFYGSNNDTLNKIQKRIEKEYPSAVVNGYKSPPIIDIHQIENNLDVSKDFQEINRYRPDIVWVGLGGIKQDLVMCHYKKHLDKSLLIGVGAVFDYFAGNLMLSTEKVKSSGFRWGHRLLRQPYLIRKKIQIIKVLTKVSVQAILKNNRRKK